jgi:phenylacetate-CoA ligase
MRLIDLYHRLPTPLRSLAASLHGYRLRRLRYGPDTDRIADDAVAAECLPAEERRRRQADALAHTLQHAAEHVPYYRDLWRERRRMGFDPAVLADWPILEKETVRRNPAALLADDVPRSELVAEHTSGTTATPLHIWWSREATRRHYGLFEARWRRWYGVDRHDRWGMLGGQLVVPTSRRRPPYWVWNAGLRQLYLSSYHLSPATAPDYLAALRKYGVRYLWGYTSSLHSLGVDCGPGGGRDLGLKAAITNAEPLSPLQRATIGDAFGCPVRETYGMAELVASASECEAGKLHLWPETGVVEVVDGDAPVAAGEAGDLIATGLLNDAMPLVRYRIGDRGALADESQTCACGRTLPQLKSLEGRSDDVLYSPDGRRVGRLDTVFKADFPIREAQIVQERLDAVRVRVVPAAGYDAAAAAAIRRAVGDRMGEVDVRIEEVSTIERTDRGKFRAVICMLPAEVRRALAATTQASP